MRGLAIDGIPVAVSLQVLKLARQPYYRWRHQQVINAATHSGLGLCPAMSAYVSPRVSQSLFFAWNCDGSGNVSPAGFERRTQYVTVSDRLGRISGTDPRIKPKIGRLGRAFRRSDVERVRLIQLDEVVSHWQIPHRAPPHTAVRATPSGA